MTNIKSMAMVAGLVLSAVASQAATYIVSGQADPWLAGVAAGGTDTWNGYVDTAPAQSPVAVASSYIVYGNTLTWTATGQVGHPQDVSGPNGYVSGPLYHHNAGNANNIPDITAGSYINALIGVFTGGSSFTPEIFVMGERGSKAVPNGATGFYMGTMDAYEWNNNTTVPSDVFTVNLTAVPEPSTYLAGLSALGMLGLFGWRNRK